MLVNVTQYLRPNGERRLEQAEISDCFQALYEDMQDYGYRLAAEILTTGHISLTIENNEEDVDIEIVANGPDVLKTIETLLQRKRWQTPHVGNV